MFLEIAIGAIVLLTVVLIIRRRQRNSGNIKPSKNFKKRLRQVSLDGDKFFPDDDNSIGEVRRSSAKIDSEAAQQVANQTATAQSADLQENQDNDIPVLFDQADQPEQDWPQQTTPFATETGVQKSLFDDLETPKAYQPKQQTNKRRVAEPSAKQAPSAQQAPSAEPAPSSVEKVLILNLHAEDEKYYGGIALFNCFRELGLRYGKHEIFHFHNNGDDKAWFQMANGVNPGTFDYDNQQDFITPMLCFILPLEIDKDNSLALERLLAVITEIQSRFGGSIKDENRSDISEQGIAHYRSQIKDFERQMLAQKK